MDPSSCVTVAYLAKASSVDVAYIARAQELQLVAACDQEVHQTQVVAFCSNQALFI